MIMHNTNTMKRVSGVMFVIKNYNTSTHLNSQKHKHKQPFKCDFCDKGFKSLTYTLYNNEYTQRRKLS